MFVFVLIIFNEDVLDQQRAAGPLPHINGSPLSPPSECVSPPSSLPVGVYVSCACCVLMLVLFSCLQVYTNRLRRLISATYYPKVQTQCPPISHNITTTHRWKHGLPGGCQGVESSCRCTSNCWKQKKWSVRSEVIIFTTIRHLI